MNTTSAIRGLLMLAMLWLLGNTAQAQTEASQGTNSSFASYQPEVVVSPDTLLCPGDTFTLIAPPAAGYLWSNGSAAQSIKVVGSQSLSVRLTNEQGEQSMPSRTLNLRYRRVPTPSLRHNSPWLCPNGLEVRTYSVRGSSNRSTYSWEIEGGSLYNERGQRVVLNWAQGENVRRVLRVRETTFDGCTSLPAIMVFQLDQWANIPGTGCDLADFPIANTNIITANNDGFNDALVFSNLAMYPDHSLTIFNRWGQQIYQASPYRNDWNGEGQGNGTYYYYFTEKRTGQSLQGFVELLK